MAIETYRGTVEGTTKTGFTCCVCHRTFEYADDWSDRQPIAETRKRFGLKSPGELSVVCDGCYNNPAMLWNAELN